MITNTSDHLITFGELVGESIEERRKIDIKTQCKYGVKILDEYLGGILPSELVVIGADTGCGKTELATTIAIENALRGKKVLFLGLEGDITEIALRYLQREISKKRVIRTVDYRFNLDKTVYKDEEQVLTELKESLSENLLIFNKKEIPSLSFVKELIHTMSESVDMIVIDHLHYIHVEKQNENDAMGEVVRELKTTTDIIKKPIILVSHLRKRDLAKDPSKFDVHGSSNISKEATTIVLITQMAKNHFEGILNDEILKNKRYAGTKMLTVKSRIGLPDSNFQLIYDRRSKKYLEDKQWLIESESGASEDDSLVKFM